MIGILTDITEKYRLFIIHGNIINAKNMYILNNFGIRKILNNYKVECVAVLKSNYKTSC